MDKILITGATGFVGKAVLRELKKQHSFSSEIHGVYYRQQPSDEGITWHRCNLLNADETTRLLSSVKPSHLVHIAWCSEHGKYWEDIDNLDWVKASINLAQSFVANEGKRCVFIGSSAEYDWSINDFLSEDSRILPESLYGASKYALYLIISKIFKQQNISWVWARLFNPFGEGEDERRLIPRTCISLVKNGTINMDSGTSKRDFLHVEDVSEAIVHVLFGSVNGLVNIASGIPVSIREIVSQIAGHFNKSHLVTFDKSKSIRTQQDFVVANVEKLNNNFHWKPSITFSQRIIDVCEWWRAENNKQPIDET